MSENQEKTPLHRRLQGSGLHWIGKKDGVHQWRGSWTNIPLWFCRMFLGLTGVMGLVAGGTGLALLMGASVPWTVPLAFGLVSGVYAGVTIRATGITVHLEIWDRGSLESQRAA